MHAMFICVWVCMDAIITFLILCLCICFVQFRSSAALILGPLAFGRFGSRLLLVQPLCRARSRFNRSPRFASPRIGRHGMEILGVNSPQRTTVLAVCNFWVGHVPAEGGPWRSALRAHCSPTIGRLAFGLFPPDAPVLGRSATSRRQSNVPTLHRHSAPAHNPPSGL